MDKLKELMSLCKCGVYVSVNEHRDYYESVHQRLEELGSFGATVPPEIQAVMEERNVIIDVQFYPNTPVSFYKILHFDLDKALDEALAILKSD